MARAGFIDTHVHLYDQRSGIAYAWLDRAADTEEGSGSIGAIQAPRYGAEDFSAETRFQNVAKVIHVQAARPTDSVIETSWVQASADTTGVPHAMVAGVDLASPTLPTLLEEHLQHRALRGVRDLAFDPGTVDRVGERNLAVLAGSPGLVFCHAPGLDAMAALAGIAARHPGLTVCVDHAGLPPALTPEVFALWQKGIGRLAAIPNTVIKVSGFGMADRRWTAEELKPWIVSCAEAFGPDRTVFGTNWPIDRLASSYGDVLDCYAAAIAEFSAAEQSAMFAGTAERLFRLTD